MVLRHFFVLGLLMGSLALNGSDSPSEAAQKSVLAINKQKRHIYDKALSQFQDKFLKQHPVIVSLFSGEGGRFILYRPNQSPLEAPPPAMVYQLAKSVGHAGISLYEILTPYAEDSKADLAWQVSLRQFRDGVEDALQKLQDLEVSEEDRKVLEDALSIDKKFADQCLEQGSFTAADIQSFARSLKPLIKKLGVIAGTAQTSHWVHVMSEWKDMLGDDWSKTYAVTNTLYVTRQNNILFSVLAQFMGEEAINQRLMIFETSAFTTTPESMIALLARIISDRELGQVFFNDYMLMDSELFGSAGRAALKDAMDKKGLPSFFPEYAHFNSNEWPWRSNPNYGSGPRTMEETPD